MNDHKNCDDSCTIKFLIEEQSEYYSKDQIDIAEHKGFKRALEKALYLVIIKMALPIYQGQTALSLLKAELEEEISCLKKEEK